MAAELQPIHALTGRSPSLDTFATNDYQSCIPLLLDSEMAIFCIWMETKVQDEDEAKDT